MNKRAKKVSDPHELIAMAVKELKLMLKNKDPKIRLRAISLILRHYEKVKLSEKKSFNDPLSLELDSIIKGLENDLKGLE
jgi:uncharacterized membrane protein